MNIKKKLYTELVNIVYDEEIEWIINQLYHGLSILVLCDKILIEYIFNSIKERIDKSYSLISLLNNNNTNNNEKSITYNYLENFFYRIKKTIYNAKENDILVIINFNILFKIFQETPYYFYEAINLLYEKPFIPLLCIEDQYYFDFKNNILFQNIFHLQRELFGIKKEKLYLLLERLIDKDKEKEILFKNIGKLYRYLSGLNVIEIERILSIILKEGKRINIKSVLKKIREFTNLWDFKNSDISLDRDIGGYKKIKNILKEEIITPLTTYNLEKDKEIYFPHKILFYGPPNTGKFLFAKGLANILDALYITISAVELEINENIINKIIYKARKCAPSIIIIKNLEKVIDKYKFLLTLFKESEKIQKEENVLIICLIETTLENEIVTTFMFDLTISFYYPSLQEKEDIINIYQNKFNIYLNKRQINRILYYIINNNIKFFGSYLYKLCSILDKKISLKNNKKKIRKISDKEIEEAFFILDNRYEYTNLKLSPEERWRIAVHKAGHCIMSHLLNFVENICILSLKENTLSNINKSPYLIKKAIYTKEALLDKICFYLSGRIAEEILLEDYSTKSLEDIKRATEIAKEMIEVYGMGEETTLLNYKILAENKILSKKTIELINKEIDKIIRKQYERGKKLLYNNRDNLNLLSAALLEHGTLSYDEIENFFKKHPLKKS